MSLIKNYLYEVTERPSEDDLAEYELYCLYLDMGERLKNLPAALEYYREVFE